MPAPQIRHCLICDDTRFELRQVVSFMGVYGATPDVTVQVQSFRLPIRLCFAFLGGPGTGTVIFTSEVRDRSGVPVQAQLTPAHVPMSYSPQMASTVVAFWFTATFPRPDQYTIVLACDGVLCYQDVFRISQLPGPGLLAGLFSR
jgi:hypothetical protein